MRVENIEELKERLRTLFGEPGLVFNDYQSHGVVFDRVGKAKALMLELQQKTGASSWDGEAGHWFYRNDEENWALMLRSVPHSVWCMATITSLHQAYLQRHIDEFQAHNAE